MKKKILLRSNSALLSVTFIVVLFALFSLNTTTDRFNGIDKNSSGSNMDIKDFSQSILQKSEEDILFIENLGQIKDTKGEKRPDILFLTRSEGVDMYMTNSGITYVFRKIENDINDQSQYPLSKNTDMLTEPNFYRLDMEFVGMNEDITIGKEFAVDQQYHYYTPEYPDGLSPKAYKKVTIKNLYDGIDLVYYEKEGRMKYDFILKAGADAGKIQMKYTGANSMEVDKEGTVTISTPMGEIREEKPYTYSESTGMEIKSNYQVQNNTVLFDVAEYAESEDIIIDPVRVWATYYGGSLGELARSICTDNSGNIYITGRTYSTDFPTQTLAGAYNQATYGGGTPDAFILKFDSNGERIWSTYYGGSDIDEGNSICTDNLNNLYVIGETQSTDFATQTLVGAYNQTTLGDTLDVFILKFDSNGVRQWATFYGGSELDRGFDVCTDNSNNLYVSGETESTDFPTQTLAGAYNQTTYGGGYRDAFILKFNSNGARQWATFYGGSGVEGRDGSFWKYTGGMCTDDSDNLYVTGATKSTDFPTQTLAGAYNQSTLVGNYTDVFILKFNSSGVRQWATYYGGGIWDVGCGIVTDSSGALYVTGQTYSHNDFPTHILPGAYNQSFTGGSEAFILKFDSVGVRLWATPYGGISTNNERGNGIALDNSGNLYIVGNAQQGSFNSELPTQTLPGAYNQTTHGGGASDAFILMFNSNGERLWATYYGGSGGEHAEDCCTDNSGNFYVTGNTSSDTFSLQTLSGAYNQDTLGGTNGNSDVYILRFDAKYCNSGGSNLDHVYISEVDFGDLSNPSGGSDYSDFTSLSTNATQNTSYPITLSFWKDVGSHKVDWKVWIDYNIDGDFEDAGELVLSADNKRKTVNGTITIPSNTSVGMTRMRVSMEDGDGSFGPCDILNWGEVEDYSVNLQPDIPQPPVTDFEGTPTTVTVGNSVNFTDLSLNVPNSWDWNFEGGTPANSSEQSPTVAYHTEGTYEVSLTATNAQGSDTVTKLNYVTVIVESGCTPVSNVFPDDPLTHSGTGSSSTSFDFGTPGHTEVSFAITDLNAKLNGKPSGRYTDSVTVKYTDAGGTKTYGTFSGKNTSSANVNISGPVNMVTVTLEDGYDGNPPGTLSIDLDLISSCPPVGGSLRVLQEGLQEADGLGEGSIIDGIWDFFIYPNPVNDLLSFRYKQNSESEIMIKITNINGHSVHDFHPPQYSDILTNQVDVSQIPPGVYLLHLESKNQLISRKFVIMR